MNNRALLNETLAVADICESHCIFVVFVLPPKIGMKKFHFCNRKQQKEAKPS